LDFINNDDLETLDTITEQNSKFNRQGWAIFKRLISSDKGFKALSGDPLLSFIANRIVDITQLWGRGIRNNVPVLLYWLDGAYAPNSVAARLGDSSLVDTEKTSLLVAIIHILNSWIYDSEKFTSSQRQIASELYSLFYNILKETEYLYYDKDTIRLREEGNEENPIKEG
jgi:hypothetical protein